jgi:hypothetical protein
MSVTKELDTITNNVVQEIHELIYERVSMTLEYSDLEIEGDDFNDAHDYIMARVIEKLYKNN